MPNMDGYEFVRQFRADDFFPDWTVIFYTAYYLDQEARSLANACGVTEIIHKPCDPEQVLQVVAKTMGQPRPRPPPVS